MKQSILFLCTILFGMISMSCEKTVSGERNKWTYNMERAEIVQQRYPGFASVTKGVIRDAEKIFADALNITDEEQKITKMNEANKLLSNKYIRDLFQLDTKIDEAKNLCDKLVRANLKKDETMLALFDRAVLDEKIDVMQKQIKSANPNSLGTANMLVGQFTKPLFDYIKQLKEMERKAKSKESKSQ